MSTYHITIKVEGTFTYCIKAVSLQEALNLAIAEKDHYAHIDNWNDLHEEVLGVYKD